MTRDVNSGQIKKDISQRTLILRLDWVLFVLIIKIYFNLEKIVKENDIRTIMISVLEQHAWI